MDAYQFYFHPHSCNRAYFTELKALLESMDPTQEEYERTSAKTLFTDLRQQNKAICTYRGKTHHCEKDMFFFENKRQVVLGRYYDTVPCFFKCSKHFFTMSMTNWSFIKNDLFIRYMLEKPSLFLNDHHSIELERVFPIRILLSTTNPIPLYRSRPLTDFGELTLNLSRINRKTLLKLNPSSPLRKLITERIPFNHVISRELCLLWYMNVYFYIVPRGETEIEPFVLVSTYSPQELRPIFKEYGRPYTLELLFNPTPVRPTR